MLVVIALCLATVPLAGGSLMRLAELRLRRPGLALGAIGLQVLIVTVAPGGLLGGMHEVLHVASYALLGAFGWANRRVDGRAGRARRRRAERRARSSPTAA